MRVAARIASPVLAALAAAPLTAQAAPAAPVAPPVDATVATHYFYWYRWPTEHFGEAGAPGPEGHCRHFERPAEVSYTSADWHAENFAQMGSVGIDVALPVYWGAPGAYDRPNLAFARRGLPAMVTALDRLAAADTAAPKLGLFYDTSTLRNDVCGRLPRGGRADLTTAGGRDLFCGTVLDYFAAIPKRHWARHRDRALVVLYGSGFAARWDDTLGATLQQRFAARFAGERVCLVADASWGEIGQDLTTSWGAALWGPRLFPGVAQIGAGYDDRAVPGRSTPVRERGDGAFYGWSWQAALRHRPELVLLETWNEMHEGTELVPTREAGTRYLELTREWIARLRRGESGGEPIELRWSEPRPLPDLSWGALASDVDAVSWRRGAADGLRPVACEDGPFRLEAGALVPGDPVPGLGRYLYLQVSDHFVFDGDVDCELEVRRRPGPLLVEYDSRDGNATLAGAYTKSRARASRPAAQPGDPGDGWIVEVYDLAGARFANRQNGGADLRFVLPQDDSAAIAELTLRRRR